MNKEIKKFLKKLDRTTWEVVKRHRQRHIHLRHRHSGRLAVCPISPSDNRALKNLQAELRRIDSHGP